MYHGSSSTHAPMNEQTPYPQSTSVMSPTSLALSLAIDSRLSRYSPLVFMFLWPDSQVVRPLSRQREQFAAPPVREYTPPHTLPNERIMEASLTISQTKITPSWLCGQVLIPLKAENRFWGLKIVPSLIMSVISGAHIPVAQLPERSDAVRRRLWGEQVGNRAQLTTVEDCLLVPAPTSVRSLLMKQAFSLSLLTLLEKPA